MEQVTGETTRAEVAAHTSPGWQLLSSWNFGLLWSSQVISQIGDGLTKVALLWFVYQLTGSALKMTVVGVLQTLPPFLLGPFIGVYLDRSPKKPVMIKVDLLRAFLIPLIPLLYALGALTLARLYLIVLLIAITSTAFGPALASAVPTLVQPPQLTAANALMQTTAHIGVLVGPAFSGLMITLIGTQNVLYLDAATFLLSALCLLLLRIQPGAVISDTSPPANSVGQDLLAGIRFLQHRTILPLLLTTALYILGTSSFVLLLPVFATVQWGAGPLWLGWLWSAWGVGMFIASAGLIWAKPSGTYEQLQILVRALILSGLAISGLSLLHSPVTALVLVPLVGVSSALFTPLLWSLLQELTPHPLLGRVFTMMNATAMAASTVGMTVFGWTTDRLGTSISLVTIGLMLLGTATLMRGYLPQLSGFRAAKWEFSRPEVKAQ
jgi:MFS family permease